LFIFGYDFGIAVVSIPLAVIINGNSGKIILGELTERSVNSPDAQTILQVFDEFIAGG
jgi:hypothetical protein